MNDKPTNSDHEGVPSLSLRPRDAAKALGISERKLWALTADKTSEIPHYREGRCLLYPVRELRDWVTSKLKQ